MHRLPRSRTATAGCPTQHQALERRVRAADDIQVDQGHAHRGHGRHRAKASSRSIPARCDFSGWNCAPITLSRPTSVGKALLVFPGPSTDSRGKTGRVIAVHVIEDTALPDRGIAASIGWRTTGIGQVHPRPAHVGHRQTSREPPTQPGRMPEALGASGASSLSREEELEPKTDAHDRHALLGGLPDGSAETRWSRACERPARSFQRPARPRARRDGPRRDRW